MEKRHFFINSNKKTNICQEALTISFFTTHKKGLSNERPFLLAATEMYRPSPNYKS